MLSNGLAVLCLWLVALPAIGQALPKGFYGQFEGTAVSDAREEVSRRDLSVEIRPHGKGFALDWTTLTVKSDGRPRRKKYSIDFRPTHRPGIFASAMRHDMFGQPAPLDPLRGDPYVWATLAGATLTVHAMLISESGGYEMQVYERTLTEDGLALRFSRVKDGKPMRTVTGTLRRVDR